MTIETYRVRAATKFDIQRLVSIENACFTADKFFIYSARHFRYCINKKSIVLQVVTDNDDNVLGYVLLLFRANSIAAHLYSIGIYPVAQGFGLGKLLLKTADFIAKKKSCREIHLEVRADSPNLVNMYRKFNYSDVKIVPAHYPDGTAAVKMKKNLQKDGYDINY